jgi:hypothetical protein
VFLEIGRAYCRAARPSTDFDLSLYSRRHGEGQFRRIVFIRSLCASQPAYSIIRHNEWISAERP